MPFGVRATWTQVLALALISYESLMVHLLTYMSPDLLICKEG